MVYWTFLLHGGKSLPRAAKSDVRRFHHLACPGAADIPDVPAPSSLSGHCMKAFLLTNAFVLARFLAGRI